MLSHYFHSRLYQRSKPCLSLIVCCSRTCCGNDRAKRARARLIPERLAQDRGVEQVQYLLAGLFGRACAETVILRSARHFGAEAESFAPHIADSVARGYNVRFSPRASRSPVAQSARAERAAQTLVRCQQSSRLEKLC